MALAMMTLCLSPPLIVLIRRSDMDVSPVHSMASSTILSSSVLFPLKASWKGILPISTISLTVNENLISLDWGTAAILRAMSLLCISATSVPSRITHPPWGLRFLFRFFSMVLLPHPFGPRIPRTSP